MITQNRLQIRIGRRNGLDVKCLDQDIQYIRRDKGRQSGTQPDVLDSQVQQGKEDRHRLLLIPREDHGQRQIIDADAEGVGQGHSNLARRWGQIFILDILDKDQELRMRPKTSSGNRRNVKSKDLTLILLILRQVFL